LKRQYPQAGFLQNHVIFVANFLYGVFTFFVLSSYLPFLQFAVIIKLDLGLVSHQFRSFTVAQPQPPIPQDNKKQDGPTCPYCQRRFVTLDELTLHIVVRHTHGSAPGPAQSGGQR